MSTVPRAGAGTGEGRRRRGDRRSAEPAASFHGGDHQPVLERFANLFPIQIAGRTL
jgi:hypothetical protein